MGRINERTGAATILLAGVVFSFGPLVFRGKSDDTDEWQFLFYRGVTLLIVIGAVFVAQHGRRTLDVIKVDIARAALAGALLAGMFTSFIIAIARIDAATTLFLQSLAPFSAALIGWLVLRERVDLTTWVAMCLAVTGVIVMGSSWDTSDAVGIGVALVIPLLFGGYSVLLRDPRGRDPLAPILAAALFGSVAGLVMSLSGPGLAVPWNDVLMGSISGGLLLGLGIPLMNRAGEFVPPARTTLLLMTEIVLAPVWVWIFVDEDPAPATLAGGAIILAALVWLAIRPASATSSVAVAAVSEAAPAAEGGS